MNLDQMFLNLLNRSVIAGLLVLVILVLRLALKKAPKWIHCVLWVLVAVRLIVPLGIVSPLSALSVLGQSRGGSVEYFHAGGGSEKPLVEFETVRIESPAPEQTVLSELPGTGLAVTKHTSDSYLPPLEMIWLAGLAGMALYALWSLIRLRRRVAASIPLGGVVFACDGIDTPFILGIIRPRIFLPAALPEAQSDHVLAHERAHLARRDHWWKPLGFALLSVYWFHPLLWLAYLLFCRDVELACDERVLRKMDEPSRLDYSQSLLDLSRHRAALACPLAFGETGVRERIKAALRYKKPAFWIVLAAVVVCVIAAVCLLTDPAYSTTVLPEEEQMLRQMMNSRGYSAGDLQTDVLYDRSGNAWCLLAFNGHDYMIVRRRGNECLESGDGNPYEDYMDVPKFYTGVRGYRIRGIDARLDRPIGDNQFYDLRQEKSAGLVGFAARRVPYPEKKVEAPPVKIDGPLFTIHGTDRDIDAYESFLWSTEWQDDGSGISADGLDPESVIRENADLIPVVRYDGHIFFTCCEGAEVLEKSLKIYADPSMQMITQFADLSGDWLSELKRLGPGKYWCCQNVRVQGQYVPAADEYNSSCYACLFCLEIPPKEEVVVPEEYQELFGDFPSVPAKKLRKKPVVVTDQEARIYNKRLLDDFYAKVQEGTPADVMVAFYLAGEEYADKPVFISLQYDGARIRRVQDFSRTELDGWSYDSDVFSYMMEFDTGEGKLLLLSDKLFEDSDEYKALLDAAREEENWEARLALSDYHMDYVLFWKKVMPE